MRSRRLYLERPRHRALGITSTSTATITRMTLAVIMFSSPPSEPQIS